MREEIQNVARERDLGSGGGGAALGTADAARQGVPRKSVAFLKVCAGYDLPCYSMLAGSFQAPPCPLSAIGGAVGSASS